MQCSVWWSDIMCVRLRLDWYWWSADHSITLVIHTSPKHWDKILLKKNLSFYSASNSNLKLWCCGKFWGWSWMLLLPDCTKLEDRGVVWSNFQLLNPPWHFEDAASKKGKWYFPYSVARKILLKCCISKYFAFRHRFMKGKVHFKVLHIAQTRVGTKSCLKRLQFKTFCILHQMNN